MNTKPTHNRPAWQRMSGRISRLLGIQYYDLSYGVKDLSMHKPAAPVFHIRIASLEQQRDIARTLGGTYGQQFAHYRQLKSECYLATAGREIQGFLWLNSGCVELAGHVLAPLPDGHVFAHAAFVFEKYRRRGVFLDLAKQVSTRAMHSNSVAVSCLVDRANTSSLAAFDKAGMAFRPAPVLKLPGLAPRPLARLF